MTPESHPETQQPATESPPGAPGPLLFLCGADMNPLLIKRRLEPKRARFVAIARMEGTQATRAGLPPVLASDEIWGIALTVTDTAGDASRTPAASATASIVLRDGTSAEATLLTDPATVGTIADVLREAHYWELPVAYRNRLQALIPAPS